MKKIFSVYMAAILIISCLLLGLSSEKTFAYGSIRYWICGECGMKTKSLPGYIPVIEGRDFLGRPNGHYHDWQEVDEDTYYRW